LEKVAGSGLWSLMKEIKLAEDLDMRKKVKEFFIRRNQISVKYYLCLKLNSKL
jgi:hypothetical protein